MKRFRFEICFLREVCAPQHIRAARLSTGRWAPARHGSTRRSGLSGCFRLLLSVAVCALILTSARAEEPAAQSKLPAGTQKMVEILGRIIGAIDPLKDPYDSSARLEQMRASMAAAVDFDSELRIRLNLARELLNSGYSEDAIQELEEVRSVAAKRGERLPPRFEKYVRDQLAISYLRLGEQQNCQVNHTIDSCVMPIKGGGIHILPQSSRNALVELTAALEQDPDDLISR